MAVGIPGWLLAMLFAVGFLVMGGAGFFAYTHFSGSGAAAARSLTRPDGARPDGVSTSGTLDASVLLKYIEVTGLRLMEDDPKNLRIRFLVVNHSQAPLTDLSGVVTLRPTTAKPDGEVVGTFAFRIPELGPNEARELSSPMKSKLRIYELPDWEFMRADLAIVGPKSGQ